MCDSVRKKSSEVQTAVCCIWSVQLAATVTGTTTVFTTTGGSKNETKGSNQISAATQTIPENISVAVIVETATSLQHACHARRRHQRCLTSRCAYQVFSLQGSTGSFKVSHIVDLGAHTRRLFGHPPSLSAAYQCLPSTSVSNIPVTSTMFKWRTQISSAIKARTKTDNRTRLPQNYGTRHAGRTGVSIVRIYVHLRIIYVMSTKEQPISSPYCKLI